MAKIKFCGMTNLEDCVRAIDLAVDFIGFVFYKRSPRYIEPAAVRGITEGIGGRAATVGVFVEETDGDIATLMDFCHLDFCQVYRPSTLEKSITAYSIKDRMPDEPVSEGLVLLDTFSGGFGGSGRAFDLAIIKDAPFLDRAFIAGGIGEESVLDALRLKPFGIDLVSSIEARPGKKDHGKMEAFVNRVRSVNI